MAKIQIPFLDFTNGEAVDLGFEVGSERWRELSNRVKEACETHGCFFLVSDNIPISLREDMFVAMKELFDLPEETKNKYIDPKPFRGYMGKRPFHESFSVDDASRLDAAQAFTNFMWPEGNPSFCETLNSMNSKMLELNFLILQMIFESFAMEKTYDSYIEDSTNVFRIMKYKPPPNSNSAIGLHAHTDKNTLTLLFQNGVHGLEVETKDGEWAQVMIPQDVFIVIVGDSLKAWSNGRLHAAKHRVVIGGDKDRYSCGLFLKPKDEAMIEVDKDLVDKDHPLLYRPFNYGDYISYYASRLSDDALDLYAGV